jgi:hypothetical protein
MKQLIWLFQSKKERKSTKKNSWYEHEASCFLLCIHDCAKKLALKKGFEEKEISKNLTSDDLWPKHVVNH